MDPHWARAVGGRPPCPGDLVQYARRALDGRAVTPYPCAGYEPEHNTWEGGKMHEAAGDSGTQKAAGTGRQWGLGGRGDSEQCTCQAHRVGRGRRPDPPMEGGISTLRERLPRPHPRDTLPRGQLPGTAGSRQSPPVRGFRSDPLCPPLPPAIIAASGQSFPRADRPHTPPRPRHGSSGRRVSPKLRATPRLSPAMLTAPSPQPSHCTRRLRT